MIERFAPVRWFKFAGPTEAWNDVGQVGFAGLAGPQFFKAQPRS